MDLFSFGLCVDYSVQFQICILSSSTDDIVQKPQVQLRLKTIRYIKIEPPRGKTNNVVFEQVRHKPVCAVTEAG